MNNKAQKSCIWPRLPGWCLNGKSLAWEMPYKLKYLLFRTHTKPILLPWNQPYHQSQLFLTTICKGYWVCWVHLQCIHSRQEENHVGALMPAVALLNAAQDHGKTATEMLAGPARLTSACKDLADVAYFSLSRLESLSTEQDTLSSSNKECQGLAGWVFFLQKSQQFCTVKKLCIVNEQHTWEPGGETSTRIHLVLRCSKMHFPSSGKAKWEGVNLPYLFCHCPNLANSKLAAAQWSSQCNFPPDYSKLGMGVFPNLLLLWFHNKLAPCTITKIALLSALQA